MKMIHERGVVLVSGGMDSCILAGFAMREVEELLFLHVRYGQRTAERELKAFHDIADHYGVRERLVADISYLREIGSSCLTDEEIDVPLGDFREDVIPPSYVPFRNAHLLSIAVSWGEARGATAAYIGAIEADSSGYPDCRRTFIEAFNRAADLGTRPETDMVIKAPFIDLMKKDLILMGKSLNAPLHLTWSCYRNEDIACGACDSCYLRLQAFKNAGIQDPIPYSTRQGETARP